MIVLDTNDASELTRPVPARVVVARMRAQRANDLYTTSITMAEIRYGIERLPDGRRKEQLKSAADGVFSAFAEAVLSFDAAATLAYAEIVSKRERIGRQINGFDAQIAEIFRAHHAQLATGNVKDFTDTELEVINPSGVDR
ncbi:MAG: type II toxin-antitoxin system VapC family toxin [Candidatus Dormiibacterota bacterium]